MRRALVGLLAFVALLVAGCSAATEAPPSEGTATVTATGSATVDPTARRDVPGVPDRAWETLAAIDAGDWPPDDAPGTNGGRTFGNREGRLPAGGPDGRIRYREWDVNRKEPGRGRDAERIVTGDDGSAWYTGDHYDSFTRMR